MTSQSLKKILAVITRRLDEQNFPFAVIGAFALGMYGLPRYTSDIDLLSRNEDRTAILKILNESGYACYHQTEIFAQLDSELGALGRIDLMFVSTSEGKEMLDRRVVVEDELMGRFPVIQPTDYIILKLMGIANDPERGPGDEADILVVMKYFSKSAASKRFEPLDRNRLERFAVKFSQQKRLARLFDTVLSPNAPHGKFSL